MEKFDANSTTVRLVNTNPVEARTLYLQSGGFAEHQIVSASLDGQAIPASFGVTDLRPGDTPDTMLRRADRALLVAKDQGRNRVEVM